MNAARNGRHPTGTASNDNRPDPILRLRLQIGSRLKAGSDFGWDWFAEASNRFTASVGDVVAIEGTGPAVVTEAWIQDGRPHYRTDAGPGVVDHAQAAILACDPMGPAAVGDLVTYWDGQAWRDATLIRAGGHGLTVKTREGAPKLTTLAKSTRRATVTSLAFGHKE